VHQRLAELHTIADKRPLKPDEQVELEDCMQINADVMLELAKIKIASEQAFITSDTDWHHEVCARIEAVSKKFIRGGIYSG
jgi:hypothetical protein